MNWQGGGNGERINGGSFQGKEKKKRLYHGESGEGTSKGGVEGWRISPAIWHLFRLKDRREEKAQRGNWEGEKKSKKQS